MLDGKAFGEQVVDIVKGYIDKALGPVSDRLAAIEKQIAEIAAVDATDDEQITATVAGKFDAEIAELKAIIEALPTIPDLPDIPALIAEAVDVVRADDANQVKEWMAGVEETIAALPAPKDGKDVDPEHVKALVQAEVDRAVAAIPAPADGKTVTPDELRPLVDEVVSKAVAALPVAKDGDPGRDGIGLAGAVIDRSGSLVVTLTNGEAKELGPIVGKDGDTGKAGTDGLGFDDLDVTHDGSRGFVFRFARGDQIKEFPFTLPVVLDKGVFKAGDDYEPGDGVTYGGSFWIAQEKTASKPDSGQGWRLAVKRGRDGKSAPVAAPGPKQPLRVGVPSKAD